MTLCVHLYPCASTFTRGRALTDNKFHFAKTFWENLPGVPGQAHTCLGMDLDWLVWLVVWNKGS